MACFRFPVSVVIGLVVVASMQAGPAAGQSVEHVDWIRNQQIDPADYIAKRIADYPVVLLGEGHWIQQDVALVARVVRQIGGAGFQVLASEFYLASLQARVDSVVHGSVWNRPMAISILRADGWPYEEYLDILKAAWEVNKQAPGSLTVIAANPGPDWRDTILPKGETYDEFMARHVLSAQPAEGNRVLVHMGFNHAFTRYLQPDSWRGDFVNRFMDRTGNILWRALGQRVFSVALHPPFICRADDRIDLCVPLRGLLDCAMTKAGGSPTGFDVAGSPFERTPVESHYATGYRDLVFGDLADGWIWQVPPDRYRSVALIPFDEYVPGDRELSEALANNPFRDEGLYDQDGLRALWDEAEAGRADFPVTNGFHLAGAWRNSCYPPRDR